MSIHVTEELKHEIRTRCSLTDVVSNYTTSKKGNLTICKCPFHAENNPSFTIYPPKEDYPYETFYCYSCHAGNKKETGIGNDVISFIMAVQKLEYFDACQFLCDKYGISYEHYNVSPEMQNLKEKKNNQNILYYQNLMNNKLALQYLHNRGITKESIYKFRLGLTPSDIPYPKNRLVFGITDVCYKQENVKTIGMAYRVLQGQIKSPDCAEYFPDQEPTRKYVNDSDSPIFKKGNNLFGMNYAKEAIRKSNYAIVVEGYFDVILMHQAGLENTVGIMGTSFTDEQMNILRKYCDRIFLFLDSDARGIESMNILLPKLLEKDFNVCIIEAPNNQDPAELVLSYNQDKSKVAQFIARNTKPAVQWYSEKALLDYDNKVYRAKMDVLKFVLPVLDKVSHRESKICCISEIADRLKIEPSLLVLQNFNFKEFNKGFIQGQKRE